MLQQINLYQPITTAKDKPFSAMTMAILGLISVLIMLSIYAALYWQKQNLQNEVNRLKGQYQHTLSVVEELETMVGKLTDTKDEIKKLARLKEVIKSKQFAFNELSSQVTGNTDGLSGFLSSLARKNVDSIWFGEIDIYQGGQQIILQGKTVDARAIPPFIESLKEEAVFNGINFKLFKAERDEEGLVNFSLRTELENTEQQSEKSLAQRIDDRL